MYRQVDDFVKDWEKARQGTIKTLEAITDEKLEQAIVEGHNTLGWIGWHMTTAPIYNAGLLGLTIDLPREIKSEPRSASKIVEGYKISSKQVEEQVKENYTDKKLTENVDQHGTPTPAGAILRTLIDHQTHHRGQLTVLLRQAGLKVPGVMGPTKEDKQK